MRGRCNADYFFVGVLCGEREVGEGKDGVIEPEKEREGDSVWFVAVGGAMGLEVNLKVPLIDLQPLATAKFSFLPLTNSKVFVMQGDGSWVVVLTVEKRTQLR